eukprot:2091643-Rhodomonas_salina.1
MTTRWTLLHACGYTYLLLCGGYAVSGTEIAYGGGAVPGSRRSEQRAEGRSRGSRGRERREGGEEE